MIKRRKSTKKRKVAKKRKIAPKKRKVSTRSRFAEKQAITAKLKKDGFRLPHGYEMVIRKRK